MDKHSFADSARAHVDKYQAPDGPTREVFLRVAEAVDAGSLEALDLIVMQKAFLEMHSTIADIYRPRSPLEAQLG